MAPRDALKAAQDRGPFSEVSRGGFSAVQVDSIHACHRLGTFLHDNFLDPFLRAARSSRLCWLVGRADYILRHLAPRGTRARPRDPPAGLSGFHRIFNGRLTAWISVLLLCS